MCASDTCAQLFIDVCVWKDIGHKYDVIRAIRLATYAADVSVTRFGVQQAMIDREGLEAYQAYLNEGGVIDAEDTGDWQLEHGYGN